MRILFAVCFCIVLLFLFSSCKTSFPVSEYSRYNQVTELWLNFYSNDSLGISIDLNGRQRILKDFMNPVIGSKEKRVLKPVIKGSGAKLFYASKSIGRFFGYRLYGFILAGKKDYKLVDWNTKMVSLYGTPYYTTKNVLKNEVWRIRPILVKARNKNLLFIWLKEMDPAWSAEDVKDDEDVFIMNTNSDFFTLSSDENYKFRRQRKDSLYRLIDGWVQTSEYIRPISAFNNISEDSVDNYGLTSFFYQMKATAYSFIDDLKSAREANLKSVSGVTQKINKDNDDSLVFSNHFKDSISQLAEKAQVLMFNESHYDWRNRWLLTIMLPRLKKQGYKYLCMEALSLHNSDNRLEFPSLKSGFYYKEPFMGNLLRTALDLGFKVIAYEDTIPAHTTIDERERTQAKNLYYHFKGDPTAKWLILAGYGHINKDGFSKGQPSMIQYFQRLCDKDVRCVNQTSYSPLFNNNMNTGYSAKGYFVVSNLKKNDPDADLFILSDLERFPYEDDSTGKEMNFTRYNLAENIKSVSGSSDYLFVYKQDEYLKLKENAIPVFIKKINAIDKGYLLLPGSKYLFFRIDANGNRKEF